MGIHDPRLLAGSGRGTLRLVSIACWVGGGVRLIFCEAVKVDVRAGGEGQREDHMRRRRGEDPGIRRCHDHRPLCLPLDASRFPRAQLEKTTLQDAWRRQEQRTARYPARDDVIAIVLWVQVSSSFSMYTGGCLYLEATTGGLATAYPCS